MRLTHYGFGAKTKPWNTWYTTNRDCLNGESRVTNVALEIGLVSLFCVIYVLEFQVWLSEMS